MTTKKTQSRGRTKPFHLAPGEGAKLRAELIRRQQAAMATSSIIAERHKRAKRGRPKTGRIKLTAYVLPITVKKIRFLLAHSDGTWRNTIGRIIDAQFELG